MPNPTAPLDAVFVREQLTHTRFADVRYFAQTSSTNADAQPLLGDPAAFGATLVAEYQSAGVGRKGRRWIAPPGSALLFTAILPQAVQTTALWAVPFWTALCVAEAVEDACDVALDLVWPNDLYIRDRKTGGILSVARIAGDDAWVGCGIGLNVVRPLPDAELDALGQQPVFLSDVAPKIGREMLLVGVLATFDQRLEQLRDPAAVAQVWAQRARLAGSIYRYRRDTEGIEREGIAQRIGAHGTLVVRDAAGEASIDMADVRVTGRAPALHYQRSSNPASTNPPPNP